MPRVKSDFLARVIGVVMIVRTPDPGRQQCSDHGPFLLGNLLVRSFSQFPVGAIAFGVLECGFCESIFCPEPNVGLSPFAQAISHVSRSCIRNTSGRSSQGVVEHETKLLQIRHGNTGVVMKHMVMCRACGTFDDGM